MDRIVHESVLTNTSDEKVNALMYQAMLDETIRLRSCRKEAERNQIRKFLMEVYRLYYGRNQKRCTEPEGHCLYDGPERSETGQLSGRC